MASDNRNGQTNSVLGDLAVTDFLSSHWQRKPLLIRAALPGFTGPVDEHDLAGLATEPWITSRLVFEHGGRHPWEVRHGPFRDEEMTTLPDSGWSLLVHAVDHAVPEVNALRDHFRFIPNWRSDDIMVSFAPTGGSVGPHLDNYDVFLVQGRGRKKWKIGMSQMKDAEFVPGLDLRILAEPKFDVEWDVGPGDMIYLPPLYPHHGVALEPGLTYSVGFRAPNWREATSDLVQHVFETTDEHAFYEDPDLAVQENPGEITSAALTKVLDHLKARIDDPEMLALWFGRYVTTPGYGGNDPEPTRLSYVEVVQRWRYSGFLFRAEGVRVAYILLKDKVALFIDGESSTHDLGALPAIAELGAATRFFFRADHPWLAEPFGRALLVSWLEQGLIYV